MVTPVIKSKSDGPVCLHFAYDMYGKSMGILNVYVNISLKNNHNYINADKDTSISLVYMYGLGVGSGAADKPQNIT